MLWPLSNQCKVYAKIVPDCILKGFKKDHKTNAYQNGGGGCLFIRGTASRNRKDLAFFFYCFGCCSSETQKLDTGPDESVSEGG